MTNVLPPLTSLMILLLGATMSDAYAGETPLTVQYLRCEYLVDPLGIDAPQPRLSWTLASGERGQRQTAYQVLVASSSDLLAAGRGDLWDSGQVASDQSAQLAYAGTALGSLQQVHWKARAWDRDGRPSSWSAPATWTMGLLAPGDWQAKWIGAPTTEDPQFRVLTLRRSFPVAGKVTRAVVGASALGVYELRMNGHSVGDRVLAPEWTDAHKRVQYQVYDVTGLVRQGENVLGALVADGWHIGMFGPHGRRRGFIARLHLEFEDGRRQAVVSDGEWLATLDGPIRHADIFDGEVYDARLDMPGWDSPGFTADGWRPAAALVDVLGTNLARLVAQPNEPIRVTRELPAVAMTEPKAGVYIYDFGQNFAGKVRMDLRAAPGVTIAIRHGEVLNDRPGRRFKNPTVADPNGEPIPVDGTLHTQNLNCTWRRPGGARQTESYTFRSDQPESYEPRFTQHGFRYAEVTGLPAKPAANALVGRVFHSSAPEVGRFACSSPLIDRLMLNILWTQRSNLMGIPTDCPQRDERLGWTGDIQAYAQTACYFMDMATFLRKYCSDLRDAQHQAGAFPIYVPRLTDQSGAPAWADAGVVLPWRVYQNYGDQHILAENYPAAKRWVDWVRSMNPDLIWRKGRGDDFGDWLNSDTFVLPPNVCLPKVNGAVPKEVFATAFFAHSTELVGRMAAILGHRDDAALYTQQAADIKTAFVRTFVQADGTVAGDTQAGYALALHFGLLPTALEAAAARRMVENIASYDNHLTTGIQATIRLMLELSRHGHHDVACQLVNQRTMPSWGYTIDQGATTIWERWDGYVPGRGWYLSLNHYALGAVGEWVWRHLVGINPDDQHPGYQHILIRPRPGAGLTWVKGEYNSIRGPIAVAWKVAEGGFSLDVTIPANTTATVFVPDTSADKVSESGQPLAQTKGVRFLRLENGAVVVAVDSGQYSFLAR